MKTKLQLGSSRPCIKFWDDQGRRTDVPDDFFDSTFKANLVVRHMYVLPKDAGVVIEVRDLRRRTIELENPFGDKAEQAK